MEKKNVAKKLIDMHNEIIFAESERRKIKIDYNRKYNEIKCIILGNKEDIKKLYQRSNDNIKSIETLQGYIQWLLKAIVGIILTVTITVVLNTFLDLF